MPTLERSSKKLQVVQTAIQLFTTHGFHNAGVDLIIKKSKIQKATFYNYFHSKERLVEMCDSKKKYWQLSTHTATQTQPINSKKLFAYMSM